MEKYIMENFLVKAAIPVNIHKKNEQPENPRLWDAIWRAHRDVLTGRFHLEKYIEKAKGEKKHQVTEKLNEIILESARTGEVIASAPLIRRLQSEFPDVEFGAIQNLVNMTLKYVIILKTFTDDIDFTVDESGCDCPLDSIILGKLPKKHTVWTKINEEEYKQVQTEIRESLSQEHCASGNVTFDFLHW